MVDASQVRIPHRRRACTPANPLGIQCIVCREQQLAYCQTFSVRDCSQEGRQKGVESLHHPAVCEYQTRVKLTRDGRCWLRPCACACPLVLRGPAVKAAMFPSAYNYYPRSPVQDKARRIMSNVPLVLPPVGISPCERGAASTECRLTLERHHQEMFASHLEGTL